MKLTKSTLQRTFTIKHKGKTYYVDYLNSDGQILGLSKTILHRLIACCLSQMCTVVFEHARKSFISDILNRFHWEILDEELEELNIFEFKDMTKEEKKKN